jgi:uncharacterized NAD-dependent epimerase/dehydratase family protein
LKRSWLILADGYLTARNAKTAHGVIRYSKDDVVAVLDRDNAGRDVAEVLPELQRSAPIVSSITEALAHQPTSFLLGVATPGGWMPDHWRAWILEAIDAGLEVVNGLHTMLTEDDEFVARAKDKDVRLWDVRLPPEGIGLFSVKALEIPQKVVLTVGSDCAVGKKTTALEVAAAGTAQGTRCEFVATGQTGVLIAGKGIAVDRVICDFLAGAAEKLVLDAEPDSEVLVVEGQGSVWHPAYSSVTLGLLHGSCPHSLILCHQAGRNAIEEPPYTKLPPLSELIATYEELASVNRPAKVACLSINTHGLDEDAARSAVEAAEDETGLPAGDVFLGAAPKLWDAVAKDLRRS